MVAYLTWRFGDLDIAEEAAAEAFATAVGRWPADGVPPKPGALLTTTAKRSAIDRIRRENKRDDKQREAQLLYGDDPPDSRRHRRRAAPVDLHLLLPGGRDGDPRCADAAHGRRSDRARDRPCLPGAGGTMGSGSPARRPRSRRLAFRIGCRPRRICRHASPVLAVLFLVFNEGYLAPAPTLIPYVTT